MSHTLGRYTTKEAQLTKIDAKQGAWGKAKVNKDNELSTTQTMISVDYDAYFAKQLVPKQRPVYEKDDTALLKALQFEVYKRTKDLRSIFAKIVARPEGRIGKLSDKIQRFSLKQFMGQLNDWEIQYTQEQLERIIAPYEDVPGEGLDYGDFSDIINLFAADATKARRADHVGQLGAFAQKPISRTTASNILQTTSASVPSGKYGGYDGVTTMYGGNCGIDVNSDGTNNGYFPTDDE